MTNKTAMNNVRQSIRENTCDMSTDEYVYFLRELATWANDEAEATEWIEPIEIEE